MTDWPKLKKILIKKEERNMNALKIQQDVLKAFAKGDTVRYSEDFTGEKVFISIDGVTGYFFNDDELRVKLHGAQAVMDIDLSNLVRPDYKLTGTDEYRRQGTARKFIYQDELTGEIEDEIVYIDTGKVKYFNEPSFYKQPGDDHPLIAVTEDKYGDGKAIIVGCVAPVKIKD